MRFMRQASGLSGTFEPKEGEHNADADGDEDDAELLLEGEHNATQEVEDGAESESESENLLMEGQHAM